MSHDLPNNLRFRKYQETRKYKENCKVDWRKSLLSSYKEITENYREKNRKLQNYKIVKV